MVKNKNPKLQLEFDFESCSMMAKNPKLELQLGFFFAITELLLMLKIVQQQQRKVGLELSLQKLWVEFKLGHFLL